MAVRLLLIALGGAVGTLARYGAGSLLRGASQRGEFNNLMVKRSMGRVMVRDNYACNNLMVTDNVVLGLRVFDNRYTRNLMIERNTVERRTVVRDNVDTGESVNECRATILEENGL